MIKPQTGRDFLKTLGLGAAALLTPGLARGSETQKKRQPNVIFILADDLGWMDMTPYGSTFYETPNITALWTIWPP